MSLFSIKLAVKDTQLKGVKDMRVIARVHQNRNLADFEKALEDYKDGAVRASSFSSLRR